MEKQQDPTAPSPVSSSSMMEVEQTTSMSSSSMVLSQSRENDFQRPRYYDSLTAFVANPLIWIDEGTGRQTSLEQISFDRKHLQDSVKEAQSINAQIDVHVQPANIDRLSIFLAKDSSPVLHYVGHGTDQYLCLEHQGAAHSIPLLNVKDLVATTRNTTALLEHRSGNHLKLVYIEVCDSARAGQAFLAGGVPHVVCCLSHVPRAKAKVFERTFYQALAVGNTLKRAFGLAKQAVSLLSYSPQFHHQENDDMQGFLLLPETADHDPYHDVQVFYTSQRTSPVPPPTVPNDELLRNLPAPPRVFLSRQKPIYQALQGISRSSLIQVTGVGNSSFVKKVCHYMVEHNVHSMDAIYWVSEDFQSDTDTQDEVSCCLRRIGSSLQRDDISEVDLAKSTSRLRECLRDVRALIVVDARDFDTPSTRERLSLLISQLIRSTSHVKFLVIGRTMEEETIQFQNIDRAECIHLPPLDLKSSIVLFGRSCPRIHLNGRGPCDFNFFKLLLVPDESQLHAMSEAQLLDPRHPWYAIYGRVGAGYPTEIQRHAMEMTELEFEELLTIGVAGAEQKCLVLRSQLNGAMEDNDTAMVAHLGFQLYTLGRLRECAASWLYMRARGRSQSPLAKFYISVDEET